MAKELTAIKHSEDNKKKCASAIWKFLKGMLSQSAQTRFPKCGNWTTGSLNN